MKAVKGEEIILAAQNKPGVLAQASQCLTQSGVNIRAINGYVVGQEGFIRFVTSDNVKAHTLLKSFGKIQKKEVVIVELDDEVGELYELASLLLKCGVDIDHMYGTTNPPQRSSILIFSCNNNDKAMQCLI